MFIISYNQASCNLKNSTISQAVCADALFCWKV